MRYNMATLSPRIRPLAKPWADLVRFHFREDSDNLLGDKMICPFDSVFPSPLWHFITCQDEIFPFNINRHQIHQIWSCHAKLIVPRSKILIPTLQIWMETVACQIYRQLTLLWYRLSFWSDMLNMCLTKVHIASPRCIFQKFRMFAENRCLYLLGCFSPRFALVSFAML